MLYLLKSFIFFIVVTGLSACSFVDIRDTVTYDHSGSAIHQHTLDTIRPGQTERLWLLENLGQPSEITQQGDGSERFVYRMQEQHTERMRIFLLYQHRKMSVETTTLYVSIRDGVVENHWLEREKPVEQAFEDEAEDEFSKELVKESPVMKKASEADSSEKSTEIPTEKPSDKALKNTVETPALDPLSEDV